jgi:hypothetical protein
MDAFVIPNLLSKKKAFGRKKQPKTTSSARNTVVLCAHAHYPDETRDVN